MTHFFVCYVRYSCAIAGVATDNLVPDLVPDLVFLVTASSQTVQCFQPNYYVVSLN
ncbi:MAG: hypothetical protein ICV54_19635 [Nostoc sp. C3-bin3]|nr:hypothetical protein [Nostoc sp. C3-bin3]